MVDGRLGRSASASASPIAIGVGIDLVQVSQIAESIDHFGDRFVKRLFSSAEIAYANGSVDLAAERFAARFAAKEATMKALRMTEQIDWRQIEVVRGVDGGCEIALHAEAARRAGECALSVSLSHQGDFAAAIVVAQMWSCASPDRL